MSAVEKLEQRFAAWLGAAGAVATGFGRSALVLALEALGVRGGEVAVPEFICAQVPEAVRRAGGRPVFYPVERDLTLREEGFQAAFGPKIRAALGAHWFGRAMPEIGTLARICRERAVPLIEDCALALGARRGELGRRAGTFGEFAVFSLTKTDWGYGGGIVTTESAGHVAAMRKLLGHGFGGARSLSLRYGLLRRADCAANRPRWSRLAELAGRSLQRAWGIGEENFYDQGRFDARMSEFAARRAQRVLDELEVQTARRRRVLAQLLDSLRTVAQVLLRPVLEPGDTAAFLLIKSPAGRAEQWVEEASRDGVTLRRCWPAYQSREGGQNDATLDWFARHLLILEVHPRLTPREAGRIAQTLRRLASRE